MLLEPGPRRPVAHRPRRAARPTTRRGISEFPHLIVNQARVLDYFAEFMANAPTRMAPDYGYEFLDLEIADGDEHPVTVTLVHTAGERRRAGEGRPRQVRRRRRRRPQPGPRGRSAARMEGDSANHAWGVMDVLAVTDFPDIRTQVRDPVRRRRQHPADPARGRLPVPHVRRPRRGPARRHHDACASTTIEQIIAKANAILRPYTLDVKDVAWHSVYEVGHRLTDRFDDVPLDETRHPHARASSSRATPATPTARRPARA